MAYVDEHIRDWPDEFIQAAKLVLADVLDVCGRLPLLPSSLHDALQRVRVNVSKGHAVAKNELLNGLAGAYATYVLIEQSPKPGFYYSALRRKHKVRRTDGDPIALFLRSIFTLPVETKKDRKAARYYYATWATAVRHLIQEGIAPDQVVTLGMQDGQSVTAWVSKHRRWRRETDAKDPAKSKMSGKKKGRPNRPLADLFGKQVRHKGDRALVEVELTSGKSGRFNVIRATRLPRNVHAAQRDKRWNRIREAIK